jgi:hypothetical protein
LNNKIAWVLREPHFCVSLWCGKNQGHKEGFIWLHITGEWEEYFSKIVAVVRAEIDRNHHRTDWLLHWLSSVSAGQPEAETVDISLFVVKKKFKALTKRLPSNSPVISCSVYFVYWYIIKMPVDYSPYE